MKGYFIFLLLLSPVLGNSQGNGLNNLIKTVPNANHEIIRSDLDHFFKDQKVKLASAKNDIKFLRSLVHDAHRKFLKSYTPYSRFDELFVTGKYDCLTGTAFFSLALESLQFPYTIIETNYHIFLMIETHKGNVLLETTDRIFGLKTNPKEIENCLHDYKANILSASSSNARHYYKYQSNLFREVRSNQLEGLLYFNQAVMAFNNHEWVGCVDKLEKARSNYDNPRIEELAKILAASIAVSDLNETVKKELLLHLSLRVTDLPVMAIR